MDARRTRIRPTHAAWGHARLPSLVAILALLLAATAGLAGCSSPAATRDPDATTVVAPPATGGPGADPSSSPSGDAPPSPATAFPVTLVDDEGTEVTLEAEPQRVVTLTPAATETLFALGLGDRVVGKVEDISLYPPEAAAVPDVAKFGGVDVEKIVGLDTDLVIAGGEGFNPPEAIARLRSLGVPVLVTYAPDVDTALADMALIGSAVGHADEAEALVAGVRAAFDDVAAATADLPKPRVFYELDATNGFFGPSPDSFVAAMIRTAGGEALTSGTPGVYEIPAEKIVAFDPEVILLGDAAYGVTPDQVAGRSGWSGLAAVRGGDVRPVDDVIVTRPGPRLGEGIRALAKAIHPELDLP